jgi:hypothetical protein
VEQSTAYNIGYGIGQLIMLALFLIPAILFLLTQQNTLRLVWPGTGASSNRRGLSSNVFTFF